MPEVPAHLLRNGRPVDNEFAGEELLFRRYGLQQLDGRGRLIDAVLQFPLSTNRQKYSNPEDVLFSQTNEYDGLGIIELPVAGIPVIVDDGLGQLHYFRPCHLPEEDNYSHTHIHSEDQHNPGQEVPSTRPARKKCRSMLNQAIRINTSARR
jgi:hypothetical protein